MGVSEKGREEGRGGDGIGLEERGGRDSIGLRVRGVESGSYALGLG